MVVFLLRPTEIVSVFNTKTQKKQNKIKQNKTIKYKTSLKLQKRSTTKICQSVHQRR